MEESLKLQFDERVAQGDYQGALEVYKKRKGKTVDGYMNALSGTSQLPFCSVPVRLDPYQGCVHSCQYCFAQHRPSEIRSADVDWLLENLDQAISGKGPESNTVVASFSTFVQEGWPIHMGGMSDPFQPIEKERRVSRAVLKQLTKTPHHLVISTKSTLPSDAEYLALLREVAPVFQMSIISRDTRMEPGAPTWKARVETVERLASVGVKCLIRLQPMIPELLQEQRENFMDYARAGAAGVIVEGLRLYRKSKYPGLNESSLDWFGREIRDGMVMVDESLMGLGWDVKRDYHFQLRAWAHESGLAYLSADEDFRHLGDSPNCCGTGEWKVNDCNITSLAYLNPNDFGFHLIKDRNDSFLNAPVSGFSSVTQMGKTVREHLKALYNDLVWMEGGYYIPTYHDGDNWHFRV